MPADAPHDALARLAATAPAPWTLAEALLTFAMWVVMMVGMMAGPAMPVLLLYAATQRGRGASRIPFTVLLFAAGYFIAWTAFSAFATLAQWGLDRAALLSPSMAATSATLGGAILVGAGLYQLTPWKGVCLRHCQSPIGFLMARWRSGKLGALRMGMHHGTYCLGCCWALMGVLFAVGVMNLAWVAALTVFVLVEKAGPKGVVAAHAGGVAMIAAGIAMAAGGG